MRLFKNNRVRVKEGTKFVGTDILIEGLTGITVLSVMGVWEVILDDSSKLPDKYKEMRKLNNLDPNTVYLLEEDLEII